MEDMREMLSTLDVILRHVHIYMYIYYIGINVETRCMSYSGLMSVIASLLQLCPCVRECTHTIRSAKNE